MIIRHLQKSCEQDPPDGKKTAVLYLYLNHKETKVQTISNLVGSLLRQLVQGRNIESLSEPVKTLFEKSQGELRPNVTDLLSLINSEITANYHRVYLLVDALDELPEDDQWMLRRPLENSLTDEVRLLITSRAYDDIAHPMKVACDGDECNRDKLDYYLHCQVCDKFDLCMSCRDKGVSCPFNHEFKEPGFVVKEIKAPNDEIEGFVKWDLDQQRGLGIGKAVDDRLGYHGKVGATRLGMFCESLPELITRIPKDISEKAQGMYLLAKLHMDSLKLQPSRAAVLKALANLSTEVSKIYGDILERIDDQPKSDVILAKKVLSWMVLARRPLDVSELLQALAVDPSNTEFDPLEQTELTIILRVTKGLVAADGEHGAVRLVHRTAQEYFENNGKTLFPDAQAKIAITMLTYLNFKSLSIPCDYNDEEIQVGLRLKEYTFFAYASTYWGEHIQAVIEEPEVQTAVMKFLKDPSKLASTIQAAWYIGSKCQSSATWDVRGGVNSLHVCGWYGLDSILTALLNETTNVVLDSQDRDLGQTPLMYACRRGHPTTVSTLIQNGADVNVRSMKGSTAIFESIQGNHVDVLDILLTTTPLGPPLDVNLTHPGDYDHTILMLAAFHGFENAVNLLLQRPGILINLQDTQGYTALALAAAKKRATIVERLLESKDIDINAVNQNGATALMIAAEHGSEEIVTQLLRQNADIGIEDLDGNTAIWLAIIHGRTSVVRAMLEFGVNIHGKDKSGRTLLHNACVSPDLDPEIVRLLFDKGANLNARGKNEDTPLHGASRLGNLAIAEMLLRLGADYSITDSSNRTPLLVAWQHGETDVMKLLQQHSTTQQKLPSEASLPLWSLAKLGYADLAQKAIKTKGSDLYVKDPDSQYNALHWSIDCDRFIILDMLLDAGMSPNKADDHGRTPLHIAAELGDYEATERLLKANPNLEAKNIWGATSLSVAQSNKNYFVATLLLEAGASVIEKGQEDAIQPTFFAALQLGKMKAVQALFAHGADINVKNEENKTVIQVAKLSGNKELLNFLKQMTSGPSKSIPVSVDNSATVKSPAMVSVRSASTPSLPSPPTSPPALPESNTKSSMTVRTKEARTPMLA